jgi:hypothetical protein
MPSATGWSANSSNGDGNGPGNGNGRAGSASAALDDPFGMRRAGREVLSLALFESRNHLLRLLALDETPDALRLAAQAGWYQEYWIARHVQRSRGEACDAQGLRLASIEPRIEAWLREVVARHALNSDVDVRISGEAFLTEPGALSSLVADAVTAVTGVAPELSTSGGTSDARFIRRLCPVVEFGLPGQSMHKIDEHAATADIEALAQIYDQLLQRVFATR